MKNTIILFIISVCLLTTVAPVLAQSQETKWDELNSEAEELYNTGRYHAAILVAKEALNLAEKQHGQDHLDVAKSLNNLGILCMATEQYSQAEKFFKKALVVKEKLLKPNDPEVASTLNNLGTLYARQAQYDKAETFLKRALVIEEETLGPDHPDVIASLNNLAVLYSDSEQYNQAEALLKRLLTMKEKNFGIHSNEVADTLNELAILYVQQKLYDQAEPLFKQIVAIREKGWEINYYAALAESLNNLAALYCDQEKYKQAEPLLKRALSIQKVMFPDDPSFATTLNNLGTLYSDYGDQFEIFHQGSSGFKILLGFHNPVSIVMGMKDLVYGGYYNQAESFFKSALSIREKAFPPNHPAVLESLHNLVVLYEKTGQFSRAKALWAYIEKVQSEKL